jgi:hypothetical protein
MPRPVTEPPFVRRFHAVRGAVLRLQLIQGACWGVFAAGAAGVTLAAADYVWELPWGARALGSAAGLALALGVAAVGVLRPLLWWSRPRTAQELEARFPQLGQRVRTVVQFSGRDPQAVAQEGVQPNLVTALEEETEHCSRPLDLHAIVPRRSAVAAAALAAVPVVLLLAGLLADWQWRLAIVRALLSDRPYTTFAVQPGDEHIDQGRDLTLTLGLTGRVNRPVTRLTRPADKPQAAWEEQELDATNVTHGSPDGRQVEYAVALSKVTDPLDYRFQAGPFRSDLYRVTIRYPLRLTKFEATLTPPRYTGVKSKTIAGGDLEVIEASRVDFDVAFDRPCREAYLLVSDLPARAEHPEPAPPATRVALEPSRDGMSASLQVAEDKFYSIAATAEEGASLPEKRYRIRVRKDQAPRVHFEDPPEAWEVNPIAEVPMKIRVDDDFGVSKAGIVFQIDNGQEQRLVTKEFQGAESGGQRAESGGQRAKSQTDGMPLTRQARVEEILCLEDFSITETSAVTYYAYVEDNRPEKPQRAETDLRFIEIRPFRRIFKLGGT